MPADKTVQSLVRGVGIRSFTDDRQPAIPVTSKQYHAGVGWKTEARQE